MLNPLSHPIYLVAVFALFSAAHGEEPTTRLTTINEHKGSVMGMAFSPDGQIFASSSRDMTIKIWDAKTHTLKQTVQGHTAEVCCVAFSSDGKLLASGSGDKTVRIWDTS